MELKQKIKLRQKRIWRIRKKVVGTVARPRLCVHFSNKHIYAQAIDDKSGKTLVSLTTLSKDVQSEKLASNISSATRLGKLFGEKSTAAGLSDVVFDRNGRLYHGCVKAFADAAREAGLKF